MVVKVVNRIVFLLVVCTLFLACNAGKEGGDTIPVENFIFKSEKSNFKLSPNGKMIAYLGLHDHCKNIFIQDLEDGDRSKQLTYQADINVQSFHWVTDDVIVFFNTQGPEDSLRVYTVNVDDESIRQVVEPSKRRMRLIQPIQSFDGALYASMNLRDSSVFDLYKVYLDGRSPQMVYENPGAITSWIASYDGVVRLALTNDSAHESILYRATEAERFREVTVNDFKTTVIPMGYVENSLTHVIALSNENRDKLAVVEYDVAQGKEIRQLYIDKNVDANLEGYSNALSKLVFASVDSGRKKYTFFEPKLENVYKKLNSKFAGYSLDFVDMNKALDKFIVRISSDTHPGELYYYDHHLNKFDLLSTVYPLLEDHDMLPMEPVKFNARDNKEIHGFITYPASKRKNCPLVVLIHDGPGRRDEWGFNPEVQFLANRGYAVFQVNYRGTLGYGKEFWSAGFKEWGGRIQSDITDGVTWLIHEGIVDKDRMAIMGTGFGGFSALHAACFNPSMYQCAITSSGYTNLFTYFREIPPHLKPYVQMYYQMVGNPEAETEFFKAISPVFHADKVTKPVLFFQGGKDRYTSVTDANQFVAKLKQNNVPVRYVFKEDEGRRFRKEENMILYYQEIESFLAKYLK